MLTTLKNGFVNFLRSRHWAEHFRRIPMLDQLAKGTDDASCLVLRCLK